MRTSWLRRSAMFAVIAITAATVAPFAPLGSVFAADECTAPCALVQVVGGGASSDPETKETLDTAWFEANGDVADADASVTIDGKKVTYTHSISLNDLSSKVGGDLFSGLTYFETNESTYRRVLSKSAYPSAKVYLTDDGKLAFRPEQNSPNSGDAFTTADTLRLIIHTSGDLLTPTIKASTTKPTTQQKPTFSATVKPDPASQNLTFVWDLGDGDTVTTSKPSVSHQYAKKGSYSVSLVVTGDDGSYGRSAALAISVGTPPKVTKPRKTPGTPTPTPTATARTQTPGSVPTRSPSTTWGGGYTAPRYIPPSSDLPSREPWPSDAPQAPVDDGLTEVEGFVLAGAEIVPGGIPETIPGASDGSSTPQATDRLTTRNIATWSIVTLGALLLMGAGSASESRWLRHTLNNLRRRA